MPLATKEQHLITAPDSLSIFLPVYLQYHGSLLRTCSTGLSLNLGIENKPQKTSVASFEPSYTFYEIFFKPVTKNQLNFIGIQFQHLNSFHQTPAADSISILFSVYMQCRAVASACRQ